MCTYMSEFCALVCVCVFVRDNNKTLAPEDCDNRPHPHSSERVYATAIITDVWERWRKQIARTLWHGS